MLDLNLGEEHITVLDAACNALSLTFSDKNFANSLSPIVDLISLKNNSVCLMAKLAAFKCKFACGLNIKYPI